MGKYLLVGLPGPVAILGFQNNVMMLDESSLQIWHQSQKETSPSEPVRLLVIQPALLSALESNLDSLYKRMNAEHLPAPDRRQHPSRNDVEYRQR